jgi:hypothetical protein
MGSFTDLSVDGYPLLQTKSEVVPEVMTAFQETDRRVTRVLGQGDEPVLDAADNEDSAETETMILYRCETHKVIDRLNVMGFTLRRAREDFEALHKLKVQEFASWAEDDEDLAWFADDWEFLKGLTFDSYASALREVMTQRLQPFPLDNPNSEDLSPTIKYILCENDERFLGYFCSDIRSLLRLACELVAPDTYVVQDITELVSAGYYDESEPVCANLTRSLTAGHPENSRRIILTEGSNDSKLLRDALDLLYPHLSAYYSFLDFDTSRSQGGAGHLVSIVKAFAGAGITNRVIALFDNDTAAFEARRSLDAAALPPNFAVLHYPDLDAFRRYPTLGPAGLSHLNINGLAASIELYFGADVLSLDGALAPIQWKGYSEALAAYQGEVMHKNQLLAAFHRKIARCRVDAEAMRAADWAGMRAILEAVFRAFQ